MRLQFQEKSGNDEVRQFVNKLTLELNALSESGRIKKGSMESNCECYLLLLLLVSNENNISTLHFIVREPVCIVLGIGTIITELVVALPWFYGNFTVLYCRLDSRS